LSFRWRVFRYSREGYGTCAFKNKRGGYRRCDIGLLNTEVKGGNNEMQMTYVGMRR